VYPCLFSWFTTKMLCTQSVGMLYVWFISLKHASWPAPVVL
jgi:hypothetical protein